MLGEDTTTVFVIVGTYIFMSTLNVCKNKVDNRLMQKLHAIHDGKRRKNYIYQIDACFRR